MLNNKPKMIVKYESQNSFYKTDQTISMCANTIYQYSYYFATSIHHGRWCTC